MPTSMPIYFKYVDFMNTLTNIKKLDTPLQIGYTHFGVVAGQENVKYILEEQESSVKDFRAKVVQYYNEQPETSYVFKKLIPYFAKKSDLNADENSLALQDIVLGVVYGMMLDLGFRKLEESEKFQIERFKD